ncbi:MAG TPA: serine/threonine-protein kinase, partial [Kofleriaceae bacterium]|nr:serine/threonine-protein kinase [Kofleriaceae bacterium]
MTAAIGSELPPAASLVGLTVGDFAIEGVIGSGSFGTVYRARQLGLDRPVAFKVPSYEIAADPVQARRFAREARAAARIVHPGVVAIYAVGELDDGRPYLAMQLIDGEPLDRILEAGPVPAPRALALVRDIAAALSETHAAGVVHRDLKPSNVMWRRDRNGDDRITLVDFGIAVCRQGGADATRLTIGGLIGTPHYMSPELAHGEQVDGRSDLYSLGCLLFELATGAPPFDGPGFEVLLAHLGRPAPRASEHHAAVPAVVDRLVDHLMQKRPDDRPASADAVVALIDEALGALAGRGSGSRRSRRSRRSSAAVALEAPARAPTRRRSGARRIALAAAVLGALALLAAG